MLLEKKTFLTKSYDVASEYILMFNCSVRDAVHRRKIKFLNKLQHPDNISCKLFSDNISHELTSLTAIVDVLK